MWLFKTTFVWNFLPQKVHFFLTDNFFIGSQEEEEHNLPPHILESGRAWRLRRGQSRLLLLREQDGLALPGNDDAECAVD